MKKAFLLTAVGSALSGAAPAFAAPPDSSGVVYEKKTVINFEDDTIQGDLTRPDGEYVEARKKVKHSNLIRVREEFRQKVLRSAGEL
ncbi:MAG: adventurous gliding motility protein CglF [Myxococcales bacterium]